MNAETMPASLCSEVAPGEGRIICCLDEQRSKLSERYQAAMQDIDLKVEK